MSGLIYPRMRQLCGIPEAACKGGVPRQASDPCHNDAQASAQQPHHPPWVYVLCYCTASSTVQAARTYRSTAGGSRLLREPRWPTLASAATLLCIPSLAPHHSRSGRSGPVRISRGTDGRITVQGPCPPSGCQAAGPSSSMLSSPDAPSTRRHGDAFASRCLFRPASHHAQPACLGRRRPGSKDVKVSKQKLTIAYGAGWVCDICARS